MSLVISRRRVALRSAIITATLAGAALGSTAAAFADTAPAVPAAVDTPAAPAAPTAPAVPDVPQAGEQPTGTTDGALLRTDQFKAGLSGRIYRHDGAHPYYTATVLKGGKQLGTLTAGGDHAAQDTKVFDGITVILHSNGTTTSYGKEGPNAQGPVTPAGVLVHRDKLKGGLTAVVYRHGTTSVFYSADVSSKGKIAGHLTAGHGYKTEETKVISGVSVTLHSDGRITSASDQDSDGKGPGRCDATRSVDIGAGVEALLTIAPDGPSVILRGWGDRKVLDKLDRAHPKLPADAGVIAEILRPESHSPQLRTKTEGGGHLASVVDFPKLPKGCTFLYGNGNGNGSSGTKQGRISGKNGLLRQTKVVPQGGVAAGAEFEEGGDSTFVALAGATAAVGVLGLGFVVLRRRTGVTNR
ncbi:hypothetical protein [Streptomyces sp. DT171]|uniref:hypothetical protein n=1 Tax=Streptomyces sp. DT171 TaxID=3416524 RepID=UPI003CEF1100